MHVLYLCQRFPYPPDKGERIRSFHQIRLLARRHQVTLVCAADGTVAEAHREAMSRHCAKIVTATRSKLRSWLRTGIALVSPGRSLTLAAFEIPALRLEIQRELATGRLDVVLASSAQLGQFVASAAPPWVVDLVDVDSSKWSEFARVRAWPASAVFGIESRRLARVEDELARTVASVALVSEVEAQLLRARMPDRADHVVAIPNGVDTDYFAPEPHAKSPSPDPSSTESPSTDPSSTETHPRAVFTGTMDYFPNADAVSFFCREVLPLIQAEVPAFQFSIVGRNPSAAVRRLARLDGVEVTGSVDDVRPFLRRSQVAVTPLRVGRGLQNKVLEALAMGLRVVASSRAVAGLDGRTCSALFVADQPRDAARAVIKALQTPDPRSLHAAARRFVLDHFSWDAHGRALERLLRAARASVPPNFDSQPRTQATSAAP